MLLHINWNAAHEIVHPAATPKVFQCRCVIGRFADGIIVHLNVHHLAVFTTKLLYLNGKWCPGEALSGVRCCNDALDYRECYRGGVGESDEDTERVGLSLSV